jgi:haloalkane dehalogenase
MVTRRSEPPTPGDRHDALSMTSKTHDVLDVHRASGRRFEAGGVASFVREQGSERSSPVVLLHGVPTSSFLYRKVLPGLADQGLRGIAFDYPGLGLADRPDEFDYTWSGLARWTGDAIDALGVSRCHLVVHDIGGPIGCEWAVRNPDRVLSLTVLNTMLDPATFHRPWSMHPFSVPVLGRLWLWSLRPWLFERLFYMQGIGNRASVSRHEVRAYYELLRGPDGGRAFLRIMRGFELTGEKRRLLWAGLGERSYPVRVVWGRDDRALGLDQLRIAQRVLKVDDPILLPAKHFLQEDQAPAIANAIADLAAPLG